MSQPSTDSTTAPYANAPVFLTPDDVDRLLHDHSADSRMGVLEKISTHYNDKAFQPREFMIAEEIFRVLMKDTELRVREMLSQHVKNNPDIPRDVILHMVEDVEKVALPVLAVSTVLSDADLIRIIETSREMSKLMAISKRESVSTRVSEALVETHYPQVVESLLQNDGADISESSYEAIIRDFPREDNITSAMVERGGLPVSIVEKLIHHVSDNVAKGLKETYELSDEAIADYTEQTREELSLSLLKETRSDDDVLSMVMTMREQDRLTPSIILQGLCRGYSNFFEIALAELADIPVANARKLTSDKGELGFRALYEKSGLPDSTFHAVRLVLDAVGELRDVEPDTSQYASQLVERVLMSADDQEVDNLPYIIALIRQNKA